MPSDALYGLAAEFESADAILAAARVVRGEGYREARAYTPFPVMGLSEALGFERTWIPAFFLGGAAFGGAGGFFMQWFANVVHLPWNVGGRPLNSWPAFVPVTFEMAILFAAVSGVTAMFLLNGLPRPYHPMFRVDAFARASRDRFFICIKASDPRFDLAGTRLLLERLRPLAVMEVPR